MFIYQNGWICCIAKEVIYFSAFTNTKVHFTLSDTDILVLLIDKEIPANIVTRAYFIPNSNKLRGRPKTTLPIVFNRDLALIQYPIRLHSSKDLAEITELAQDRKRWRGLASQIEKAAEESHIKNCDATRQ